MADHFHLPTNILCHQNAESRRKLWTFCSLVTGLFLFKGWQIHDKEGKEREKNKGSCRLGDLTVFLHSCFPGSTDIPKASIRRPKFQKIKSPNCKISSLVFWTFVQARKKTLNPRLTVSVKEAQAYAYSPVFEIESFSDLIILRMALSRVVIVFIRL